MEDKYTPTIHYRYGQLQRENAALRAQLDEALDMILLAVDQIMDGDGLWNALNRKRLSTYLSRMFAKWFSRRRRCMSTAKCF